MQVTRLSLSFTDDEKLTPALRAISNCVWAFWKSLTWMFIPFILTRSDVCAVKMKASLSLLALALLAVGHVTQAATTDKTIYGALKAIRRTLLVDLVDTAGLSAALDDPNANLTMFAPLDSSIPRDLRGVGLTVDQLKAKPAVLKSALLNHVIQGSHLTRDFVNERVFDTLDGLKIRTNHYVFNNRYYVDGSQIVQYNLQCKNGVLHGVQHLLSPIKGDIMDVLTNNTDLSTLVSAIQATGLEGFLRDQNPITIFAPTNQAFTDLGSLLQDLLAKPDLLREILKYHVIPGSLYRGGMHSTMLHTFEEADQITLTYSSQVDGIRFSDHDVSATNGVVHVIRSVMVPASLKDQL